MYQLTTSTKKIANCRKRIRAISGGSSAGKTISIIQLLIDAAQTDKKPTLTSITSESLPHLKKSAMRDFMNIMESHNYFKSSNWNATDKIYTFETGSKIEFFGLKTSEKVKGPRRDRLFINEANHIPFEIYNQLEVRTNELIYLDWNPTNEFWAYTDVILHKDICDHLTLTYKDNEALLPSIVQALERRRNNKNWWKVYGEGQLGEIEAQIYRDWQIIEEIPHEARLVRFGLDFGFSHDEAAIVAIYYYNGGYILDEILYLTNQTNDMLGDVLINQPVKSLTKADSAEPKSIQELRNLGVNILPVEKGTDSVIHGIRKIQGLKISVTARSTNLIKEYRNYMFEEDNNGKITTTPCGIDHLMDATRYGFDGLINVPDENAYKYVPGRGAQAFSIT